MRICAATTLKTKTAVKRKACTQTKQQKEKGETAVQDRKKKRRNEGAKKVQERFATSRTHPNSPRR